MKNYLKLLVKEVKNSWTMIGIAFFTILGVAETQFVLLQPVLGEKLYGISYFFALSILALLRLKGLAKTVRDKQP